MSMMDIETSSPLTAIQPQGIHSHGSWQFGSDIPMESSSRGLESSLFGPKLDRRCESPIPGRFDMDSIMESSPASSLAADISVNFHIDKTPQAPTPKRTLFSNALKLSQGLGQRPTLSTPEAPSSPGDAMDMSPLPHKPPYKLAIQSPCDLRGNITSSPTASPCETNRMEKRPIADPKKRMGGLARPSLMRKGSTTGVSFKSTANPPIFSRSSTVPQINLEKLFGADSPERMTKSPLTMNMPPPPKFGGPGPNVFSQQTKAGVSRPKGKIRRTISMFDREDDVMDKDVPKFLSPKTEEATILPSFSSKDDNLRRIDHSTLCDVLDGKYKNAYEDLTIVDCRFDFEFQGGHIDGAINISDIHALEKHFLKNKEVTDKKDLVIFHCEFSAHRAPRMALHLRKVDRQVNMARYPYLHYPEIYIMEGGYSKFFDNHKTRCEPQDYVLMNDERFKVDCEREMTKFRNTHKMGGRSKSMFNPSSFGMPTIEDSDNSPSNALSRRGSGNTLKSLGGKLDESPEPFKAIPPRGGQRRMASY